MNATDVNAVVDKLAEKVGVAAAKLQPVAEQAIHEYQRQAVLAAVLLAVLAVIGACMVFVALRTILRDTALADAVRGKVEDTANGMARMILSILAALMGVGFAIAGAVCSAQSAMQACAPTYHCLKALMG